MYKEKSLCDLSHVDFTWLLGELELKKICQKNLRVFFY